jgi:hypothetical protein
MSQPVASACTTANVYSITSQQDRCEFVRENCTDQFTTFDFTSFAYCQLREHYFLIVAIYVLLCN